jgi:hypothetical protein
VSSDFSRDRSFNAMGLRRVETFVTGMVVGQTQVSFDDESTMIGFDFTATTNTYRARYNGDAISAITNRSIDPFYGYSSDSLLTDANSRLDRFQRSSGGNSYVGYVDWDNVVDPTPAEPSTKNIIRRMLFGARTLVTDMPSAGSITFTGSTATTSYSGTTGENATITVDFATRAVNVVTGYRSPSLGSAGSGINPPAASPMTMSGTLDPLSGRISGTVTSGEAQGRFEGALYGPRAAEIGIVFTVGSSAGLVGRLLAGR